MIEVKEQQSARVHKINSLEVVKYHLDNGLNVNALKSPSQGLVKMILSYDKPAQFAAASTLAEITFQLLKSGTRKHDLFSFVSLMEETGVMISANAFSDYGVIEFVVLEDQFDSLLPLIMEMISVPAFPEDEFERIRTLALQNWRISRQQTHMVAREQFMKEMYHGHPYGIIPTEELLLSMKLEDVRGFHKTAIAEGSPVIYLAAFAPESITGVLNNYFGRMPVVLGKSESPVGTFSSVSPVDRQNVLALTIPGSVQSSIRIGRRLFTRNHPDFVAGKVTATILGGYFSSRLMANLREDKGYTYGVGAGIIPLVLDGYLTVSAEVGNEHLQNAVEEITKEIKRLRTEMVDHEELMTVKQYISGSMLRETDGIFNQLSLLATLTRQGVDAGWLHRYMHQVASVSAEDILRFADQYLNPDDLLQVTCGKQISQ
ncbi:MAG: pitrilysin family protein [Bacteroidales bacterium]